MSECLWCRKPVLNSEKGRSRRYCCRGCRQRSYEARKYGMENVWAGFREKYTHCYLCEQPLDWAVEGDQICTDHKIATVQGGRTVPENLRPVHVVCNARKADKLLSPEFFRAS